MVAVSEQPETENNILLIISCILPSLRTLNFLYYCCYDTICRYCQIGNAVAVPVSRALGYALGLACRKLNGNEPLVTLPSKFSHSNYLQLSKCVFGNTSNEVNSRQFRALDAEATPGSIGQDSRVEDSTQLQTCYNNQPGNTD